MASKKEIERLEKRIELLEMEIKQLKTVEPEAINERFKLIEETLYRRCSPFQYHQYVFQTI